MARLKAKPNNQQSTESVVSSSSSIKLNEFNKPIIAKLKAGVKLQVTERVAEKQGLFRIEIVSFLYNKLLLFVVF